MLLELPMGGMFFLFLCRTARRMTLIQVWLTYNHPLVLAPFFPSHFQLFFLSLLKDNPAENLLV